MEYSYRYFENRECQYFPCHKGLEHCNCLFCYCPMYHMDYCLGTPKHMEIEGHKIKVCTNCTFPHQPENYDIIVEHLKIPREY